MIIINCATAPRSSRQYGLQQLLSTRACGGSGRCNGTAGVPTGTAGDTEMFAPRSLAPAAPNSIMPTKNTRSYGAAAIEAHAEATGRVDLLPPRRTPPRLAEAVRGCACRGDNGYVHLSCLVRHAQSAVGRRSARQPDSGAVYSGTQLIHWFLNAACANKITTAPSRLRSAGGPGRLVHSWSDWAWARTFAMENLRTATCRTEPEVALTIVEILLARRIDIGDVLLERRDIGAGHGHLRGLAVTVSRARATRRVSSRCSARFGQHWLPLRGARELRRSHRSCMLTLERGTCDSSISEAIELTRELIPLALSTVPTAPSRTSSAILALALCSLPRLSLDSMIEGGDVLMDVIRVSARAAGPEHPDVPGQYRDLSIRAYLEARGTRWWRKAPR